MLTSQAGTGLQKLAGVGSCKSGAISQRKGRGGGGGGAQDPANHLAEPLGQACVVEVLQARCGEAGVLQQPLIQTKHLVLFFWIVVQGEAIDHQVVVVRVVPVTDERLHITSKVKMLHESNLTKPPKRHHWCRSQSLDVLHDLPSHEPNRVSVMHCMLLVPDHRMRSEGKAFACNLLVVWMV